MFGLTLFYPHLEILNTSVSRLYFHCVVGPTNAVPLTAGTQVSLSKGEGRKSPAQNMAPGAQFRI